MSRKTDKPKKKSTGKIKASKPAKKQKKPSAIDYKLNKIRQMVKRMEHKEVKLPKGTLVVDDADRNEARKRLINVAKELF
ncbi:MAG: hypothetical protein ACTSO9_20290, partial [Candidatus Helarchaeota archaeon]